MVKIQKTLFASLDPVKFQTRRFFSEKNQSKSKKKSMYQQMSKFCKATRCKSACWILQHQGKQMYLWTYIFKFEILLYNLKYYINSTVLKLSHWDRIITAISLKLRSFNISLVRGWLISCPDPTGITVHQSRANINCLLSTTAVSFWELKFKLHI